MIPTYPATIVLIPGLWLTALSWERWIARYTAQGHHVIARSWPGMDGDVEALRRDPSALAHVGVVELVEHYEAIVRGLDGEAIIMGHAFGGLVTQMLLHRGLGAAGVAIDAAPLQGVFGLPWEERKSRFPPTKPSTAGYPAVTLHPEDFHGAFCDTVDATQSLLAFERYAVPAPGRVLVQAALADLMPPVGDVTEGARAPLLVVTGAHPRARPRFAAITAWKTLPAGSHFLISHKGWEEVADSVLAWATHPVAIV